jgi:transposase
MSTKPQSMHVARIVRRYRGKTYATTLLRTSFRHNGKVKHHTLANLSHLPDHLNDVIRRSLKGEAFAAAEEVIQTKETVPHGHVQAVLGVIRKLGVDSLIASTPSRQRDLILALIAERLLFPCSKLATTRHWHSTTLAAELGVADANESELYQAMDWLLTRQPAIEQKLAQRHLGENALVLYDVSSSFYHGRHCPLACYGHSRDGKKGLPIIVYGLLTDDAGRPVAVEVYAGNTSDPKTVPDQVRKLRDRFGLERVVLVGDRGMLTQAQIDVLRTEPGLGWISALRSAAIRKLLAEGPLEPSLFDTKNLAEIRSPDFPGERLFACYNPLLAERRRQKREALLVKTEEALQRLTQEVARRRQHPLPREEIGLKAGRLLNRWKMAKHFRLIIADGHFAWQRRVEAIAAEETLDGIYVVRTSEKARRMSAADGVRHYKRLAQVERAFRSLKGLDLMVRPIFHRVEPRVKAHILLCLLAYYVQWEMRRAWAPLLFADEEVEVDREQRDPVASAQPSASAKNKRKTKRTEAGQPVHSFRTLLAELGQRSRVTYRVGTGDNPATFQQVPEPTPLQAEALRLLGL